MAVGREKNENHQNVEQGAGDTQVALAAGIVDLCHRKTHLSIDDTTAGLDYRKKQPHNKTKGEAYGQFQQQNYGKFQIMLRHRHRQFRSGAVNRHSQYQNKSCLHQTRQIAAAQQWIEQDKSRHPHENTFQ